MKRSHCPVLLLLSLFVLFEFSLPALAQAEADPSETLYLVVGVFSSEARAGKNARLLEEKSNESIDVRLHNSQYRLTIGPLLGSDIESIRSNLSSHGIDSWLWRVQEVVPVAPLESIVDTVPEESSAEERPAENTMSLVEAVHLGLERNLRLLAAQTRIDAARGQTGQARSALLPQLGLQASQTAIDEDRAEAGNGRAPEFQAFATLSLRQLIYSDDVSAAYQISKILEQAAGYEYESRLQDTVLDVSIAYLTVLRAESLVSVFRDDLKLTSSNLDRANVRLSFGVANKSEVYRWQTRLASSNSRLLNAIARSETARVMFNRVLNQPLEKKQPLQKPDLRDETFLLGEPGLAEALQNPQNRQASFEFWQQIALANAPELAIARSQLSVAERTRLAARRSLTRPTVALTGEFRKRVSKDGAGVTQLDFTIPGTGEKIGGITDEEEWNATLVANLPLYAGGERLARIRTANADVEQARFRVDETQLNIRARLLSQYHSMMAALQNIEHARVASEAGANNLELVIESYTSGVVTIIDLLDAQLAALTSALDAANAEYDFLTEYFRLQRISGKFDLLMSAGELDAMRSNLRSRLRY